MRLGEKIMRERQVLINQITIMAGIKLLLGKMPDREYEHKKNNLVEVTMPEWQAFNKGLV